MAFYEMGFDWEALKYFLHFQNESASSSTSDIDNMK